MPPLSDEAGEPAAPEAAGPAQARGRPGGARIPLLASLGLALGLAIVATVLGLGRPS
jgi:hypothetical protein